MRFPRRCAVPLSVEDKQVVEACPEAEPIATKKRALPTPMHNAIQKGTQLTHVPRRSSRIQQMQHPMMSVEEIVEEPVAKSLFDVEVEVEQSVRRALPTPMRRAIVSRGRKQVVEASPVAKPIATKKRALPTPMRNAIRKGR